MSHSWYRVFGLDHVFIREHNSTYNNFPESVTFELRSLDSEGKEDPAEGVGCVKVLRQDGAFYLMTWKKDTETVACIGKHRSEDSRMCKLKDVQTQEAQMQHIGSHSVSPHTAVDSHKPGHLHCSSSAPSSASQ